MCAQLAALLSRKPALQTGEVTPHQPTHAVRDGRAKKRRDRATEATPRSLTRLGSLAVSALGAVVLVGLPGGDVARHGLGEVAVGVSGAHKAGGDQRERQKDGGLHDGVVMYVYLDLFVGVERGNALSFRRSAENGKSLFV
jgi:hypothetical protein